MKTFGRGEAREAREGDCARRRRGLVRKRSSKTPRSCTSCRRSCRACRARKASELKELKQKYAAVRAKLGKVEDEEDALDEKFEAEKKKNGSLVASKSKLEKDLKRDSEEISGLQSQLSAGASAAGAEQS